MINQRKSQIQMGETIAIVFIFMVLMIFGALFYLRIMRSGSTIALEENMQLKAIEIAQKASFLPEIQCSEEGIVVDDCIDLYKLDAASQVIANTENRLFYYDSFGYSKISVAKIFPEDSSNNPWIIYENIPDKYNDKKVTYIPVSILDPYSKNSSFGYLGVEVFR